MKKVIEEVHQVEGKVNADIKQAQSRASEIRNAADKNVSEKVITAKEKGREILQAALENAKKDAERLGKEKIRQADAEKNVLMNSNAEKINSLVGDICKIILTTEYEADTK
jgi:hypothetical protein